MMDTIAAIATPLAPSAIGIIRISGPEAIAAVDRVFTPAWGDPMARRPDRLLVYGTLRDAGGAPIEQCLATVSRGPHSYTGEDTAELQCHGSPVALTMGLEALFAQGVRQARPGEFTRRAFLAGKLDLTRTEAVADLIHAQTAAAVRQAAGQLDGVLAHAIDGVYDGLTNLMAHFCAVLDNPDEDIPPLRAAEISSALQDAADRLDALAATYRRGRAITEGIPCAIIGRPNAGKSTLFNALLGYDRAIVTAIPGTTRDTVEERVNLGDILLRLIDTAGLRETEDQVERIGVERSRRVMERSELILAVLDLSSPSTGEELALVREAAALAPTLVVLNKADLPPRLELAGELKRMPAVSVSAKTGQGLDELGKMVAAQFPDNGEARAGGLLTNARQAEAAGRARQAVGRAASALEAGLSPDAVLSDVEEAMAALGELTGRSVGEDVTARVFERFCLGK